MTLALALVPESLQPMVEAFGFEPVRALVEAHGGSRIWVPKQIGGKGKDGYDTLVATVGQPLADWLVQRHAATDLFIPRCLTAITQARNQQIVADSDAGMSMADLVRKYHLTDRWLWRILKETNTNQSAHQGQLFG